MGQLANFGYSQLIFTESTNMTTTINPIAEKEKPNILMFQKQALKIGKQAVRNSKKTASDRTEILQLIGTYHWLINKQYKARKWFDKAIQEGERLGARPDLARTYAEVAKCLLDVRVPNAPFREGRPVLRNPG